MKAVGTGRNGGATMTGGEVSPAKFGDGLRATESTKLRKTSFGRVVETLRRP
jgi:hypothetical protein